MPTTQQGSGGVSRLSAWWRTRLRQGKPSARPRATAEISSVGAVLSVEPPVIYTTLSWPDPTKYIRAFGSEVSDREATILVYMSWIFDGGAASELAVADVRQYRAEHPLHEVRFLCNAPEEVENLAALGEGSVLLNHNLAVSGTQFRPLPSATLEFDAIYNARPVSWKRMELAGGIRRAAYISSSHRGDPEAAAIMGNLAAKAPQHAILNPYRNGEYARLTAEEVNAAYNRSAVGLCLSAIEGAMLSSTEYLLAGLPIVTTPNRGGRDVFFDDEYCITAEPDPEAIRTAVESLRDRHTPRDYIRQRTLEKIQPQRRAFLALLDEVLVSHGFPARFGDFWPWDHRRDLCQWGSVKGHFARARDERSGSNSPGRPRKSGMDQRR